MNVAFPQRSRSAGFSLFELGVVVTIFAILVAVLMQRLSYYQEEAERAGADLLLANMRSALYGKALEASVRGNEAELAALDGSNPVPLLQSVPENYLGELEGFATKQLPPGTWYFDRTQRMLVYVTRGKKSFSTDSFERKFFKVEFTRLPTKNAKPNGTLGQVGSVALIQVDSG